MLGLGRVRSRFRLSLGLGLNPGLTVDFYAGPLDNLPSLQPAVETIFLIKSREGIEPSYVKVDVKM